LIQNLIAHSDKQTDLINRQTCIITAAKRFWLNSALLLISTTSPSPILLPARRCWIPMASSLLGTTRCWKDLTNGRVHIRSTMTNSKPALSFLSTGQNLFFNEEPPATQHP